MDDEQKLRFEQDRGHRAARILEDEIFKDAIAAVKANAHDLFRAADSHDLDALQVARVTLACVEAVEKQIVHHMNTGKMATTMLERIQAKIDFAKKRKAA